MWTEIKSVVPSAHVTYPNDILTINTKKSNLNTLRGITSLDGVEVQLTENPSEIPFRKFCWGKIYAPQLFYDSEDDILKQLKEENYLDIELVKRQMKGEDRNPTCLLKIKFQSPTVPYTIYCLDKEYDVEKYFPPPWGVHSAKSTATGKITAAGPLDAIIVAKHMVKSHVPIYLYVITVKDPTKHPTQIAPDIGKKRT